MKSGISAEGKNISKVLDYLKKENAIDNDYDIIKQKDSIIIPVKKEWEKGLKKSDLPKTAKLVSAAFQKKQKKMEFKEALKGILSESEIEEAKTAYDLIGTIAVLEIDENLEHKKYQIAEALLKSNNTAKTVVRKAGAHAGELRIQSYEILAGEKTLKTLHKENRCVLNVVLDKVYYSPRSATERKRVAELVKPGEDVLVMFSGLGPFVCVIAKNTEAKHVVGIELNEFGHDLAVQNVVANKLKNVELICGDVREVCPDLAKQDIKFDRIIMPLPKTADEFLPWAIMVAKNNATIHLYDFVDEKDFPKTTIESIEKHAKESHVGYKILNAVKCGQFSPTVYRVCVDFQIELN